MIREKQVPMREQDPAVRAKNFDEVPFGYTADEAAEEAARCLQCPKAPCVAGCPVGIDIPVSSVTSRTRTSRKPSRF